MEYISLIVFYLKNLINNNNMNHYSCVQEAIYSNETFWAG